MTKESRFLHVLLIREGEYWVAQALDIDIAAQGRTQELAEKALISNLKAQAQLDVEHGREPFEGIPPAPPEYWDAFVHARPSKTVVVEIDDRVPPYMIQAIAEEPVLISH